MEPNQLTCPQCGLVNNNLSESCAQCGIIFVKNPATQVAQNDPAMQAQAKQDEQKRKEIQEAETILEQHSPAAENVAPKNETVSRPDPAEDTIEMMIPDVPGAPLIKPEAASADEVKSEETQKPENSEIEMEAIETSIEMVTEPTDPETLFLSDVKAGPSAQPTDSGTVEKSVTPAPDLQTAVEPIDKTTQPDTDKSESKDQKHEDKAVTLPETESASDPQPHKDRMENATEAADPTKAEYAAAQTAAPENAEKAPTDTAKTAVQEIPAGEKPESMAAEKTTVENEIRTPEEPAKKQTAVENREEGLKDQQQILVKEALKKHRESKAKAEILKKEKAALAKAAALKKKKLERVKAEALKKQKAAQAKAEALKKMKEVQAKAKSAKKLKTARAKAEALKKQKQAQAIAEASTQELQVASSTVQEAAAQTTAENLNAHARLLGLLKRYKGKAIGINYDNSAEIKEAELIEANEEFFSVMVKEKQLQYSYPLKSILTIIEGQQGVETGPDYKKSKFDAVIKVYPLL